MFVPAENLSLCFASGIFFGYYVWEKMHFNICILIDALFHIYFWLYFSFLENYFALDLWGNIKFKKCKLCKVISITDSKSQKNPRVLVILDLINNNILFFTSMYRVIPMFHLLASKPEGYCKPDKMGGFTFHQTCHGEMLIAGNKAYHIRKIDYYSKRILFHIMKLNTISKFEYYEYGLWVFYSTLVKDWLPSFFPYLPQLWSFIENRAKRNKSECLNQFRLKLWGQIYVNRHSVSP